jgi:membrane fusion protein (multidrug efflux system)
VNTRTGAGSPRLRVLAWTVRTVVGLALIAGGIAVVYVAANSRTGPEASSRADDIRQVGIVEAAEVETAPVWTGYGTARARRAADIAAEVAARVVARPIEVEEGYYVTEQRPLFELESIDYAEVAARTRATVLSIEAQLEGLVIERQRVSEQLELAEEATALAQQELEKLKAASNRGGVTDIELERTQREITQVIRDERSLQQLLELIPTRQSRLEAELTAQQAQLRIDEQALARTTIAAPFDGFLQEVHADIGERVQPGQVVARLVDMSLIEVPLRIPISAADSIQVGDDAVLTADSGTHRWEGKVARIAPEADAQTRTMIVFIEVEQPGDVRSADMLLPGQFVMGEIRSSQRETRVIVPRRAVRDGLVLVTDDRGMILTSEVNVVRYVDGSYPEIDPIETEWAVVASGAEAGDRIIVTNLDELQPGSVVEGIRQTATPADGEES